MSTIKPEDSPEAKRAKAIIAAANPDELVAQLATVTMRPTYCESRLSTRSRRGVSTSGE